MSGQTLTLAHIRAAIDLLKRPPPPATFLAPPWMASDPEAMDVLAEFRTPGHPFSCPLPFEEIILPDGTREPFWLEADR